jgi:hypothetical protein
MKPLCRPDLPTPTENYVAVLADDRAHLKQANKSVGRVVLKGLTRNGWHGPHEQKSDSYRMQMESKVWI